MADPRSPDSTGLSGRARLGCTPARKAEMLESTQWLSTLEWKQLEALAAYFDAYELAAETEIFREGDAGAYMAVVVSGVVQLVKEDSRGREKVLGTISSGKTLGELALIDGSPRSARAIASGAVTLLVLTREKFEVLIKDRPSLGVELLLWLCRLTSQRLRQTSGKWVDAQE